VLIIIGTYAYAYILSFHWTIYLKRTASQTSPKAI
jgi:hypothetical protein